MAKDCPPTNRGTLGGPEINFSACAPPDRPLLLSSPLWNPGRDTPPYLSPPPPGGAGGLLLPTAGLRPRKYAENRTAQSNKTP